jgi:6-phosphogluconolactonase (cycloisomerase 2 family)
MRIMLSLVFFMMLASSSGATPVSFVASLPFEVTGLGSTESLAVSPDSKHVYVAADSSDAIGVFTRDILTGALTLHSIVTHPPDLFGVDGVTVSPDGQHVYTATSGTSNLAVFERDDVTGALTFIESHSSGSVPALFTAFDVAVTPDGDHVYVTSINGDALVGFSRDDLTGELAHIGQAVDGQLGTDGLDGVRDLVVSPDGQHVYTAAQNDNAVAVFSRDAGTGVLTFVEAHFDDVDGVDGLKLARGITISPDGQYVYVAGELGVAVFSRNAGTGELTFVEADTEGNSASGAGVVVSPSGEHVYLIMAGAEKLRVYDRDGGTGEVTLVQEVIAGENGVPETGSFDVVTSPDGEYLYTTGPQAVFRHTAVECSDTPLGGCDQPTQAGAAKLLVKDDSLLDRKDKVVWKFVRGPATTEGDFGDPAGTFNDYALCIYDGSATGAFLEALMPTGGGCGRGNDLGGVPCWKAVPGKGFKYKRRDTVPHGIVAAKLLAGAEGRTKLIVKGKKEVLPLGSGTPTLPVTVQLQNANGDCWEAVYSTARRDDGVIFKAKSD